MSTFWNLVAAVFLIAVVLLVVDMAADNGQGLSPDSGIHFTDLETECRYDKQTSTEISKEGDSLRFKGNFYTPNPDADIDYDYSVSGNQVTLNIFTENSEPLANYEDTCAGLVSYDGKTDSLDPGLYYVTLMYEGERVEKVGIRVR